MSAPRTDPSEPTDPRARTEAPLGSRYDVVVAGARCAGAATAMLLARGGLRVLVVDPSRPGSDTLSTHALMRGSVTQLSRWKLLDRVLQARTPAVRSTTFLYGARGAPAERIEIPIAPRDGAEALYAPRRTVLDGVLQAGATEAGADVRLGWAVRGLVRREGVVEGVELRAPDGTQRVVRAGLVVGADGIRSTVARLVGAETLTHGTHATATIYVYVRDPGLEGYVWGYRPGAGVGAIPTNGGEACVFTSMPPARFEAERRSGLEALHGRVLAECSPELAGLLPATGRTGVRAFAGLKGFVRRGHGPGWALVGDAAYFRDPLTAHGITDALREAELLADAILTGGPAAVAACSDDRTARVRSFMRLSDRIAALDWTIDELRELHLELSREMRALAESLPAARPAAPVPVLSAP